MAERLEAAAPRWGRRAACAGMGGRRGGSTGCPCSISMAMSEDV